jgi:hypothetical protein
LATGRNTYRVVPAPEKRKLFLFSPIESKKLHPQAFILELMCLHLTSAAPATIVAKVSTDTIVQ